MIRRNIAVGLILGAVSMVYVGRVLADCSILFINPCATEQTATPSTPQGPCVSITCGPTASSGAAGESDPAGSGNTDIYLWSDPSQHCVIQQGLPDGKGGCTGPWHEFSEDYYCSKALNYDLNGTPCP